MRCWTALFLLLAPTVTIAQGALSTCPVDASAKRQSTGEVITVDGAQAGSRKTAVSLQLRPRDAHHVTGATVVVHALSARARTLPVSPGAPDITREFSLTAGPGSKPEFTAGISLDEPATVLWLDVKTIRYADKSVWRAKSGAGCRVDLDDVVLVAALP